MINPRARLNAGGDETLNERTGSDPRALRSYYAEPILCIFHICEYSRSLFGQKRFGDGARYINVSFACFDKRVSGLAGRVNKQNLFAIRTEYEPG